jgi:hypothetical protein
MLSIFTLCLIGALTGQHGEFPHTPVHYVEDPLHGVVCYYIPAGIFGNSHDATISCVRVDDLMPPRALPTELTPAMKARQ